MMKNGVEKLLFFLSRLFAGWFGSNCEDVVL